MANKKAVTIYAANFVEGINALSKTYMMTVVYQDGIGSNTNTLNEVCTAKFRLNAGLCKHFNLFNLSTSNYQVIAGNINHKTKDN